MKNSMFDAEIGTSSLTPCRGTGNPARLPSVVHLHWGHPRPRCPWQCLWSTPCEEAGHGEFQWGRPMSCRPKDDERWWKMASPFQPSSFENPSRTLREPLGPPWTICPIFVSSSGASKPLKAAGSVGPLAPPDTPSSWQFGEEKDNTPTDSNHICILNLLTTGPIVSA